MAGRRFFGAEGSSSAERDFSKRDVYRNRYRSARIDILVVVVLTVFNMVAILCGIDRYFLFSASVPYLCVLMGKLLCGMLPDDYYPEGIEGFEPLDTSFLVLMLIFAFICVALYLLSWLMSKKHGIGWMIFALVFFAVDTVVYLLFVFSVQSIIDLIFHGWFIFALAQGIHAYYKLQNLQLTVEASSSEEDLTLDPDAPAEERGDIPSDAAENPSAGVADTPILYPADTSVKARILLEADAFGHNICYRRVKRVNELVIDGNVYDKYEDLIEQPHKLMARLDGHTVYVGYDGTHSYITVDGETFERKLRLI